MKTAFSITSSVLAIFGLLTNAYAADNTPSKPFTPITSNGSAKADNYIGGSVGSASGGGKSWKLYSGIRASDNLLVELGYANLGETNEQDSNGSVSQKSRAVTLTGLATLPMNEQIELFGKAGVARWNNTYTDSTGSTKTSANDVVVGAGANYDLGDNMGVRAEWERFKNVGTGQHANDIDLMSVGVTFSSL